MTTYNPLTMQQMLVTPSGAFEKLLGIEATIVDLAEQGFITLVISATTPSITNRDKVWLDTSAPPAVAKAWNGAAWTALTPALLRRHIGGVGFSSSTTAPVNPADGDLWWNDALEILLIYLPTIGWTDISGASGGTGVPFSSGTTLPSTPADGQLFWHTSLEVMLAYVSGIGWVDISGASGGSSTTYTEGATAPASPQTGARWFNTTFDILLTYTSSGWVQT